MIYNALELYTIPVFDYPNSDISNDKNDLNAGVYISQVNWEGNWISEKVIIP